MPESPSTSDSPDLPSAVPPRVQVAPPVAVPPPVVTPQSQTGPTIPPPRDAAGGNGATAGTGPVAARPKPIPPPPPPRATLVPVRPAGTASVPKATVASGVGSAKSGRWRAELPPIQPKRRDGRPAEGDEPEDTLEETKRSLLSAMPSWLVSTVIHLVVLVVLALITTPVGSGITRVMLTIGQGAQETPVELSEFSIDTTEVLSDSMEEFADAEVEIDVPMDFDTLGDAASDMMAVDLGAGMEISIEKPMFGGRSGAMKKALLAMYGGNQETENAVALGLAWLKKQQQRNGSWSMRGPYLDGGTAENNTAATAMALIAFMGAGNTHKQGEYADQVMNGMKWLVAKQDRSGYMAKDARDHERLYAQAQATIALCELYAMTKDSWLRGPAQLALDFAADIQAPEGGWRYEPRFDSDTSVTGWFVMALQSGLSSGLEVKPQVFYGVIKYLDSVESYEGAAYSYQRGGPASPAMTAEGLLCRQYLGWERNTPAMARGLESLAMNEPIDMSDRDVYYWYYATQALHHYGGDLWTRWNDVMKKELPASQVKSGAEKGSWSPQRDAWGGTAGRLYTTCLSIYCLEVYYRHMPLYSAKE